MAKQRANAAAPGRVDLDTEERILAAYTKGEIHNSSALNYLERCGLPREAALAKLTEIEDDIL